MDEAWKRLEGTPTQTETQRVAAMIYIHTVSIHYYQGTFADAEQAARRGLALAEVANKPAAIAEAANLLGVVHDMRAESEKALSFYARSADLYATLGNENETMRERDNQATTFFRQGDWATAATLEQQGLAYWHATDDRPKQAILAMNMTEREAFQGRWDAAEAHITFAIQIFSEIEDYRYIRDVPAETLCGLSDVACLRQQPAQVLHYVDQALALLADEGDLFREEAIARRLLGLAIWRKGIWRPRRRNCSIAWTWPNAMASVLR